jgi:hypothetical protein
MATGAVLPVKVLLCMLKVVGMAMFSSECVKRDGL